MHEIKILFYINFFECLSIHLVYSIFFKWTMTNLLRSICLSLFYGYNTRRSPRRHDGNTMLNRIFLQNDFFSFSHCFCLPLFLFFLPVLLKWLKGFLLQSIFLKEPQWFFYFVLINFQIIVKTVIIWALSPVNLITATLSLAVLTQGCGNGRVTGRFLS